MPRVMEFFQDIPTLERNTLLPLASATPKSHVNQDNAEAEGGSEGRTCVHTVEIPRLMYSGGQCYSCHHTRDGKTGGGIYRGYTGIYFRG